jgi:hypothetical protein
MWINKVNDLNGDGAARTGRSSFGFMGARKSLEIFFELGCFIEYVLGAELEAFVAKYFVRHSAQHNRGAMQAVAADRSEHFDAAHVGHANVEAHDVRFEIANRFQGFDAVAGRPDDFQFRLKLAQAGESFAQLGGVVDDEHTGLPEVSASGH